MSTASMTGFAALAGQAEGLAWEWEVRSVNARGLDIRVRLPDGLDVLEAQVRKAFQARLTRGSVQIGLRVRLAELEGAGAPTLNPAALDAAIAMLHSVAQTAQDRGLNVAPVAPSDLLQMQGVLEPARLGPKIAAAAQTLAADLPALVDLLVTARAAEGAALAQVLGAQIDKVADLVGQARAAADARSPRVAETLKARVAALIDAQDRVDADRLAQELALLAVKADITEEIDRLGAHVDSARALLAEKGASGRRLDFLMQEFNREANTLCSKSLDSALTAVGLELKVVIDQMREQCQNVE